MKNKKVLSLLLAGVMVTAIPFNVFADTEEEQTEPKTEVTVSAEEPEKLEVSEEKVSEVLKAPATDSITVNFELNGGTGATSAAVKSGETLTKPTDPKKDGFDFAGWYSDEKLQTAFDFSKKITGETTLYAKWEKVTKFTVKFDSNGGSTVGDKTVEIGQKVNEPTAPTKEGYTFKGWYDGDTKVTFPYEVTKDVTLKAQWEKNVPVTEVLSISERYYDNGRFYGKVTADGDAVKGATVKLYDYDGYYTGKSDVTDDNGYFDIYVGDYYYGYYDDDYYYDSAKDKYYYYDSYGYKQYINYNPYRYWNGRYYDGKYYNGRYYGGYLLATDDNYQTSSKYYLNDGRYWDGYYRDHRYYDKHYYDKYDKKVYPTDISRTSYSTSGYLKGYGKGTVYVYDDGTYLGSDVIDSNGYFKVTWNSPYVSTGRTLDYYVNGTYKADNGYSIIPTVNAVSAGAKYVRGNAGFNASVTVYDASGNTLGNTTAGNTGIYNVVLNRALIAGETIKVESKEAGKVSRSTEYKVGGVAAVSTEKVSQPSYIAGFPDGTFKPSKEVTRAEAVRMFVKLVNNGAELPNNPKTSFKDANNAWYSDEINYAVSKGFIKGYSDNTFKPNQAITRAEFAQMISVFVKDGYPGTGSFKDVKGHWASDAINELYGNKNIKGYSDGTFKPDQKLTRAEAVTILNSVFGRNTKSTSFTNVSESGLKKFTDVPKSHWAYYEILDASNGHNAAKTEKSDEVSVWQ